jgi:hypothetical protein
MLNENKNLSQIWWSHLYSQLLGRGRKRITNLGPNQAKGSKILPQKQNLKKKKG